MRNITAAISLALLRYHVIAYDSLWHGYSTAPEPTGDAMLEFPEQLIDIMDTLGIDRATVGGASAGAFGPLYLAINAPERVNRLILTVPGHIRYPDTSREAESGEYEELRRRQTAVFESPTFEAVRARLEWLMFDGSAVTDELVEVRAKLYSDPAINNALRNYYGFTNSEAGHRYDFGADALASVSVPTLVLWPRGGQGAAQARGEWLASAIPGATLEFLDGTGHWPQWEQPDAHDQHIIKFMSG